MCEFETMDVFKEVAAEKKDWKWRYYLNAKRKHLQAQEEAKLQDKFQQTVQQRNLEARNEERKLPLKVKQNLRKIRSRERQSMTDADLESDTTVWRVATFYVEIPLHNSYQEVSVL